jgi:AcrR family transcriptional regulator
VNTDGSVKQRILDAALNIVEEQGIKALTQPRIAKTAGVRQSHLTYYFPRKADLFTALLQASHDRASKRRKLRSKTEDFDEVMRSLQILMFDRHRMRFFLGIVLEASEEPALRTTVAEHARRLAERVAPLFGKSPEDPAVISFIDTVRGIGLRMLLESTGKETQEVDLEALAAVFGLCRKRKDLG